MSPITRSPRLRTVGAPLTAALAAGALVAGLGALAAAPAGATTFGPELVVNGTFESGVTGWRTNNATEQKLSWTTATAYAGKGAAVLTRAAKTTGSIVLNDQTNSVTSVPADGQYHATAAVRTSGAALTGQLRVREVLGGAVTTHATSFSATSAWQVVELDFTAKAGASLDLNVFSLTAPANATLTVDAVSLTHVDPRPTLTNGSLYSERGIPEDGVLFGAAVGGNTDPAAFEQQVHGTLGVRRTYWNGTTVAKAVETARGDLAVGRVPWLSFKLPYSWSEMAAGKGDAWTRDLVAQLDALEGPVWLAFHHEPEGDGDITQWVAMQRHLAPLVRGGSDNIAMTVVLTGWHQLYGAAQYSLENLWPGDGLIDLIGYDVYNQYGVIKNGVMSTKTTDMAKSYFQQFQAFSLKHGVAWGLGETGFTDRAAQDDPQWLARTYQQMETYGGVAMAYFNTSLNSAGSWVITTQQKADLFAAVLNTTPKLR